METAPIPERRPSPIRSRRDRDGETQALALVLEEEAARARELTRFLTEEGYEPARADDVGGVLRALRLTPPDLVIIGTVNGGDPERSVAAVEAIRRQTSPPPVILLVDQGSEALAVAALRAGASDYVNRSEAPAALRSSLARVCCGGPRPARCGAGRLAGGHRLVGDSAPMSAVRQRIRRVARSDSNLLVTGETGTGKELVAELVHRNSPRRRNPFIPVNCAAIPDSLLESELFGHERGAFTSADRRQEGKLRAAAGGTLFLDEIGDMSACTQAKILRAIEYKEIQRLGSSHSTPVDVRIIAATNHDLEGLMAGGGFRQDLYFRLDVARIDVPPLRERREDLSPLCRHFVGLLNQRFDNQVAGIAPEAYRYLFLHSWPGNVRELKNVLEATFVNEPPRHIRVDDLPAPFLRRFGDARSRPLNERDRILWALHACRWNKTRAAAKLHWSRMTLYRKLDRYHIVNCREALATPPVDDRV